MEFIKTNHSIVDAAALAIYSPAGIVVHTGDFKVDYTPVYGDAIDLQRFAEIGKKGVLALMCDSTNAERPGFTPSEKTVGKTFDTLFEEHKNTRIFVATFASNVDRVQQIINTAYHYGRKVVVEGRSMVNVIGTASELGYINIPENTLIDIEHLKNYKKEDTVLITTGSQGESLAALSRMAADLHKKVSIMPGDVVILSSTPIPGNEKAVARVINELSMKGAEVINQDTHVSGHACQEEIKLMYSLVRPKFSIPVHGEYRHLMAQRNLAISMGIPKENVILMRSGDVIEIGDEGYRVADHVQAGGILVDGLGIDDTTKEGKIIKAMSALLGEMAEVIESVDEDLSRAYDQINDLSDELEDLEADLYEEEDEDGESEDAEDEDTDGDDDAKDDDIASEPFYEVACPNCGETVYVSEDDLDAGEANCAHCGVTFEVALEGDGEEDAEDGPVQYEVTCPDCGTTAVFEEDELLDGAPKCPNCGKPLDFEVTEE